MNGKSSENQMELLSMFENSSPKNEAALQENEYVDVLDFNCDDDASSDSIKALEPQTRMEAELPLQAPIGIPVFEYAGASEPIKNLQITFEDLRKEKCKDFPELEKKEKVTWTMDYGIVKMINDTSKTISQVKAEMEGSKEFLDVLKKSRKPITCKVKPKVSGQTKGVVSSYKGVFTHLEDAAKSGKVISIVPSKDGRVYEIRNTEIGLFVTRTHDVEELDLIVPCFRFRLPKIPLNILQQIVAFFRSFIQQGSVNEAMVNLLWDRQNEKYTVCVPEQLVSKTSVKAGTSDFDEDRYLHLADIHSHNTMSAKFSATDNEDEKATRLYMVIGKLDRYFPEICVRISNGGKFHEIHPSDILEGMDVSYPEDWHSKVTIARDIPKDDYTAPLECGAA